jgi:hypothetical protein
MKGKKAINLKDLAEPFTLDYKHSELAAVAIPQLCTVDPRPQTSNYEIHLCRTINNYLKDKFFFFPLSVFFLQYGPKFI